MPLSIGRVCPAFCESECRRSLVDEPIHTDSTQSHVNRDTVWFADATLNYAENLLSQAEQTPEREFIVFSNESGEHRQLTGKQLLEQVSVVQQWLLTCDVGKGDVVAGYLPYLPETVIAMLATTSLGAIWTSTSPDFGIADTELKAGDVVCVKGKVQEYYSNTQFNRFKECCKNLQIFRYTFSNSFLYSQSGNKRRKL